MRFTWIAASMLGLLPAVASAGHRDSVSLSFGIGIGYRHEGGYRDYDRRREYCYAPRPYYRTTWYEPAPVYYAPPAVVYERPVVVYQAPPPATVIYSTPGVSYSTTTVTYGPGPVVCEPPRYVPVGGPYYYTETRYYYGR